MSRPTTARLPTPPEAIGLWAFGTLLLWLSPLPARLMEGSLLLSALYPVAAHPRIRAAVHRLDRRRRLVLGTLILLVVAGQLAGGARAFPFVSWQMYSTVEHGDPVLYEYQAVLQGGRTAPIVVSRLLHASTANRVVSALHIQIEALTSATAPPDSRSRREHEALLIAVGRLYNRAHLSDPAKAVVVTKRPAGSDTRRGHPATHADVLWQVELP